VTDAVVTNAAVLRADRIWADYVDKLAGRDAYHTNSSFRFQCDVLRDMLRHLAVVLQDERLPAEQADRILRYVMYGAPSLAAAEENRRLQGELVKKLAETRRASR
jgi:hypothetical protein